MKQTFFIFLLSLLFLTSCKEQMDNTNKYNKEYSVGQIPGLDNFLKPNKNEKSLDSTFNGYDTTISFFVKNDTSKNVIFKRDFINNRSRFLMIESINGIESNKYKDELGKDGFSALCDCGVFNDTLFISSGIGFFGGAGISLKVYGTEFSATFFEYIDDVKPYKQTIHSEFTNNINVGSKYQFLQFKHQPGFKPNQQLTGYLTLTTKEFFENRYGEKLDTNYVKVKFYFTCNTKQVADLN